MKKSSRLLIFLAALNLLLTGCMNGNTAKTWESAQIPEIPEKLNLNEVGMPVLKVYNVAEEKIEEVGIEQYVMGVVAGEMKNDWPLEALKAQAILARTFVLKFCDSKESKYDGADISTDIAEAQAYAPAAINERVRRTVEETRGIVMSSNGEYPYSWFYAHAGGKTELPSVALDFKDGDPDYLAVVDSPDSEKAPEDVKSWSVTFNEEEVLAACRETGLKIDKIDQFELGEIGESGRAKTFLVNGQSISAPSFRIHIGSERLKSTLIDSVEFNDGKLIFSGRGYGHGVGMSQWGAYALAEEGKSAEEIVEYYYRNTDIVELW